jgi:hypothetical protein
MSAIDIQRDERTVATENASYRWGFLVLSFGLLLATAYRSFARGEASWDLIALVIIAGGVTTAFQAARRVLTRRWMLVSIATMLTAALLAGFLVLLR